MVCNLFKNNRGFGGKLNGAIYNFEGPVYSKPFYKNS